jgi:Tfp pilus assembly protein PilF
MLGSALSQQTRVAPNESLEAAWLAWRPGVEIPRWQDFLPPPGGPCTPTAVFDLLQVDIEFRAKAGRPGLVQELYFQHLSLQEADRRLEAAQQVELIVWEYMQRWKRGQRACREEYINTFPEHAARLRSLVVCWNCPKCDRTAIRLEDDHAEHVRCPACQALHAVADLFPERPWTTAGLPAVPGYTLLGKLGGGGMGTVYRARDTRLGRDLAVKVLHERWQGYPSMVQRFNEEAWITAQLQHPGIPPVHELSTLLDGRPYLAMKLVKGRTLDQLLRERPSPQSELPRFLKTFEQICHILAYAHERRVLHRDLKPSNVMVGAFAEVQVMDWGLTKVLGGNRVENGAYAPPGQTVTDIKSPRSPEDDLETRRGLGTPAYMPPEQARGIVERIDRRADVFGLGAILCEILTGQPPYTGTTRDTVLGNAILGQVEPAYARLEACGADRELVQLAKACLAARLEDRLRDAGLVAATMTTYLNGVQEKLRAAEVEQAAAEARAAAEEQARKAAEAQAAAERRTKEEAEQREAAEKHAKEKAERLVAAERRRRQLVVALAAALLLLVAGGGAAFLRLKGEQDARDYQHKLREEGIAAALSQGREAHQELKVLLDKRDGVFRLLDRPTADWKPHLDATQAALRHAQELESNAEQEIAANLRQQTQDLKKRLDVDQSNYKLALQLEQIEAKASTFVAGKLFSADAEKEFRKTFQDRGLFRDAGKAESPRQDKYDAELVKELAIKDRLLASLDEWAVIAWKHARARQVVQVIAAQDLISPAGAASLLQQLIGRTAMGLGGSGLVEDMDNEDLQARLFRVAQLVDPDPAWKDKVRDPAIWGDRQALRKLSEQALADEDLLKRLSPQLLILLGELLGPGEDSVRLLRRAQALSPADFYLNNNLGVHLLRAKLSREAEAFLRAAVAVRPESAMAWYNLGLALHANDDLEGASDAFQRSCHFDERNAIARHNLGVVCLKRGEHRQAAAAFREALERDPKLVPARSGLGDALYLQKDARGAIGAYRMALALDSKLAPAWTGLGTVLRRQGKLRRAAHAFRKARKWSEELPESHWGLGLVLQEQGDFTGAEASLRRVLELLPPNHAKVAEARKDLNECQQWRAWDECWLSPELAREKATADEQLALAELWRRYKKRYRDAVTLYAEAFARHSKLAERDPKKYRFHAARAAALAAVGAGRGSGRLRDTERVALRKQALVWLQEALDLWHKHLDTGQSKGRDVQRIMNEWLATPDLASIWNLAGMETKPEREDWRRLWHEVTALRDKAMQES